MTATTAHRHYVKYCRLNQLAAWVCSLPKAQFVTMLLLLAVALGGLFYGTFAPGYSIFSNDGPFGALMAECKRQPAGLTGAWQDLNGIGDRLGGGWPGISWALITCLGPTNFAKFYAPLGLLLLGLSAWCFFRKMNLAPLACVLGGLAAALNSLFFSTACWGIVAHPIVIALCLLAMAALADLSPGRQWLRVALAGVSVGCAVADGADMGGILALFVGAYAFYQAMTVKRTMAQGLVLGVRRLGVLVAVALLFAAQAVVVLFDTQVHGVAGLDQMNTLEAWDSATQWSFPKRETLSEIVPGLFGYRMDTPMGLPGFVQSAYQGGQYWGAAGRDPKWDRYFAATKRGKLEPGDTINVSFTGHPELNESATVANDGKLVFKNLGMVQASGVTIEELRKTISTLCALRYRGQEVTVSLASPTPQAQVLRYSGGGPYSGVLVVLVAIWAAAQAIRKKDSAFTLDERKMLWFWVASVVIALLLAYGRFAPFYKFIYPLPFFRSIRNPAKFLDIVNLALVVLFAYGMHALCRRKLNPPRATVGPTKAPQFRPSSATAGRARSAARPAPVLRMGSSDRRWIKGSFVAVGLAMLGWITYARNRVAVEEYLQTVGFDNATAHLIAVFSLGQVGWAVLFMTTAVLLFSMALAGRFSCGRGRSAWILFPLLLAVDLGHANLPWILFINHVNKNEISAVDANKSSNPVIEFLRAQAYEHRVAAAPLPMGLFGDIYRIDWMQHQFQYFNIQCLDIVQMPRAAEEFATYRNAFSWNGSQGTKHLIPRQWQLSSTRYLLGPAEAVEALNSEFDAKSRPFHVAARFDLAPKSGVAEAHTLDDITAIMAPTGHLAVIQYDAALPKAKLYTDWEVRTNDQEALREITAPGFDAGQRVVVSDPIAGATKPQSNDGTVKIVSYRSKDMLLRATASAPSILLLNDRFDPNWKVLVDGKLSPLLRCNYIMRGVQVPPGSHSVEFQFKPPLRMLYVSLGATLLAIILCAFSAFPQRLPAPGDVQERAITGPPTEHRQFESSPNGCAGYVRSVNSLKHSSPHNPNEGSQTGSKVRSKTIRRRVKEHSPA